MYNIKKKKTKKFIVMKLQYVEGEDFMDYLINQKNSVQLVSNIILSYNHLLKSYYVNTKKNSYIMILREQIFYLIQINKCLY